jgi:hypothetical protein
MATHGILAILNETLQKRKVRNNTLNALCPVQKHTKQQCYLVIPQPAISDINTEQWTDVQRQWETAVKKTHDKKASLLIIIVWNYIHTHDKKAILLISVVKITHYCWNSTKAVFFQEHIKLREYEAAYIKVFILDKILL